MYANYVKEFKERPPVISDQYEEIKKKKIEKRTTKRDKSECCR